MKSAALLALLLVPIALFAADGPYSEEDWMREGLANQIPKFKQFTVTPHPEFPAIAAIICETEVSWWGRLRILHHTGDKIDWIAQFPDSYPKYRGHYIVSCKWHHLAKLQMWILESFESTHRGNGALWIWSLEGHQLRLLLHTVALGQFWDTKGIQIPLEGEVRIAGGQLDVAYRIQNGSPYESVFLTGTLLILDAEGKETSCKLYAETWTWDAQKRVFARIAPKA